MQNYHVQTLEMAISPLAATIKSHLSVGPTLWLVPGGSNIPLACKVMQQISYSESDQLTIALSDERFGSYNHPDSNWTQLKAAGFDPKNALVLEALSANNLDLSQTVANYQTAIERAFSDCYSSIGQFGMGADGHIAGILPGSEATHPTDQLVVGYTSDPFVRITLTLTALSQLSAAFVICGGEDKQPAIKKLIEQDLPTEEQPAQIIKQLDNSFLYWSN